MNSPRLAHETLPPTPHNNNFTCFTPPAGRGSYRLKIEKMGCGAMRWLEVKFMQHSG